MSLFPLQPQHKWPARGYLHAFSEEICVNLVILNIDFLISYNQATEKLLFHIF